MAEWDPRVKEYMLNKMQGYTDEDRSKIDTSPNVGQVIGALLTSAAAGIGGGSASAAGQSALNSIQAKNRSKLDDFDRGRANRIQELGLEHDALKSQREDEQYGLDQEKLKRELDPNSEDSKLADQLARSMGYRGGPITAARFKEFSPVLQKRYEIEQSKLAKAQKDKELTAQQAKQRGLYESGAIANQQFDNATAPGSGYDPTDVWQFIDNSSWAPNLIKSDKAIEAQSAQDAWIESYLRDASGAAIPESERYSYKKQFFPQPGDPQSVVANKALLRQQKMENARAGAGDSAPVTRPNIPKSVQQRAAAELAKRRNAKRVAGGD